MNDRQPAVVLQRSSYLEVLQAAQRAAVDPTELPILLETIKCLEAQNNEVTALEGEVFEEINRSIHGIVGNEDGYYKYLGNAVGKVEKPSRLHWKGKGTDLKHADIFVYDSPPLPSFPVENLFKKGWLKSIPAWGLENSPFKAFQVSQRWESYSGHWTSEREGIREAEGAWLISGKGEAVAWVPVHRHAAYLAECANAMLTLVQDVGRSVHSVYPTSPSWVKEGGLLGLVRMLVVTIQPENGWGRKPPPELVLAGQQLVRDLSQFCSDRLSFLKGKT